nr:immunoglobulin light chain junction region [Macaca mulatta]
DYYCGTWDYSLGADVF